MTRAQVTPGQRLMENPYRFTTNFKQRCPPPDLGEERMPKLRMKAPTTVVADYFRLFVNRCAYRESPL